MPSLEDSLYDRFDWRLPEAGGPEDPLEAGQKNIQRVADHLLLVFERGRFVNVFANAVIEAVSYTHLTLPTIYSV